MRRNHRNKDVSKLGMYPREYHNSIKNDTNHKESPPANIDACYLMESCLPCFETVRMNRLHHATSLPVKFIGFIDLPLCFLDWCASLLESCSLLVVASSHAIDVSLHLNYNRVLKSPTRVLKLILKWPHFTSVLLHKRRRDSRFFKGYSTGRRVWDSRYLKWMICIVDCAHRFYTTLTAVKLLQMLNWISFYILSARRTSLRYTFLDETVLMKYILTSVDRVLHEFKWGLANIKIV